MMAGPIFFRLFPVMVLCTAAGLFVAGVEGYGAWSLFNSLPMIGTLLLAIVTLRVGKGRWSGGGWKWPLGTLGFALPAVGLSLYLHWGYATDRDDMASAALDPTALFRYLPVYALFAGAIGFAIGWIAGRNVT